MKQFLLNPSKIKFFNKGIFIAAILIISLQTEAQTIQQNLELVMQNPTLVSGTDKKAGAVYRFSHVAAGYDALLTITKTSDASVEVNTIDVTNTGWTKAFQPEIGKKGNVSANQQWWVLFNLTFVATGTSTKKTIDKFYASAIDVDGDNQSIQEFIQMYEPDSVNFSPVTSLTRLTSINTNAGLTSTSKTMLIQGPVQNYGDIDTNATKTMVMYTFKNVNSINFLYGAKVGSKTTSAGLRLNSLWFKGFNLSNNIVLPISLSGFSANYDKKNAILNWSAFTDDGLRAFAVERSSDGVNFSDIALVFADDNSTQAVNYAYKDANVSSVSGFAYYRLRIISKSGEGTYSDIKMIRLSQENTITLSAYPNPASDQLRVTLPAIWQGKAVSLDVYSIDGTRLKSIQLSNAGQTETIQISSLPSGFYLVRGVCEGQVAQQKIVKD